MACPSLSVATAACPCVYSTGCRALVMKGMSSAIASIAEYSERPQGCRASGDGSQAQQSMYVPLVTSLIPPPIQQRMPPGAFQAMLHACDRSLIVAVTARDAPHRFVEPWR